MDGRGHLECERGRGGEEDGGGAQMKSIESCISAYPRAGISHNSVIH